MDRETPLLSKLQTFLLTRCQDVYPALFGMNLGRPSFQRLFGRSRYQYLKLADGKPSGAAILQRERFATAAIAFCLKHDPVFRAHFWKSVCWNRSKDEHHPQLEAGTVWLEPPAWADLSIRYLENRTPTWIVIEVKAGASLNVHQNPTLPEFSTPGTGYGWLFGEEVKRMGAKMRYILLGMEKKLGIPDRSRVSGIEVQERGWDDLLSSRPFTPLSDDLVTSLAELNLQAFAMEQAKKIEITNGLAGAGRAWMVISSICRWLGATHAQQQFDAYTADPSEDGSNDGSDEFGMYLKSPPKNIKASDVYRRIARLSGKKQPVIWFGYLTDDEGSVTKSVYVYCRDEKGRDELAAKLQSSFDALKTSSDGDEYFVVIESPPEKHAASDFEWFKSVLDRVAKAASKKRV